ncbi:MAG: T9SS type A sorting domain-containing protein [Ignavibacteria bacterium]|nr:T9SS type A sorting domain-containing protein [Ignavibacteria bacterium]
MKNLLNIVLVILVSGYAMGQVAHQIILEKKYSELPFGIRMENSGNYSIASFDVVGDAIYCTNFNDGKNYIISASKIELRSPINKKSLDIVEGMANDQILLAEEGKQDLLFKKIFYNKPSLLKDDGGILKGSAGESIKIIVEDDSRLLIQNEFPGLNRETLLNFPSNLACADFIGIDAAGNSYLLIETYVTQIPLSVKREVYTLSKEGTVLSKLELPSTNFIYTIKDLQIDAAGNLYHLYSDENGIKIFKWSGLANHEETEVHYPSEFVKNLLNKNRKMMEEPKHERNDAVYVSVSRATAVRIGESYALHQYKCSSANLSPQNVTGPDGDIVRTPAWLLVGSNARIPYRWGGFNTLAEYDAGLSNGKYAGDINTSGVSSYAVGVDCSGFVSRCWQLSYQSSTREMPAITTQYANWDLLKPGDAILIPGHVRLFINRTPNGYFRVVESSARGWDVSYWTYSASSLASYVPTCYNNMESAANLNQPNLLHALILSDGKVSLKWNCDTTNIIGYRVYHSFNGDSWSLLLNETACQINEVNLSSVSEVEYFRVASVNKIGLEMAESNWSNSMGVRKSATPECLIVDGFKRNENSGSWEGAGHTFAVKYGKALSSISQNFETVSNTEVLDSTVQLINYENVFWIFGDESTADETFSHAEQTLVKNYLENGGTLFVSGSEIGWDLSSKGDAADKDFYKNYLKSVFVSDDAASGSVTGVQNSSLSDCQFYFGQTYEEDYPDVISPTGGSVQCMQYANGKGAGNQYSGVFGSSSQNGKLIYLSFPLETSADDSAFNKVILKSMEFFQTSTSYFADGTNNPIKFSLGQNYPNPFNPETSIRYAVAQDQYVSLRVFDILGNEIETLVDESKQPGIYTVNFIAKGLSSGVYFYRLRVGENVKSKKMILLK